MMKRLSILVVEDEAMIAFLLSLVLEGLGHEICAIEGDEAGAVAAARRCRPDLMIVDEHLGHGSGLAVVEEVLQEGPTPHIFVSGDTARILKLMPGAIVLEKPYFEADLEQAIWRAVASPLVVSPIDSMQSVARSF